VHPVLFQLGAYQAHSYGLMMFLAFAIPLFLGLREAKKSGLSSRHILILTYFGGWSAVIGARAMGIVVHLIKHPVHHDWKQLVLHTGSAYLGGLLTALAFAAIYLKVKSHEDSFLENARFFRALYRPWRRDRQTRLPVRGLLLWVPLSWSIRNSRFLPSQHGKPHRTYSVSTPTACFLGRSHKFLDPYAPEKESQG